MPVVSPCFTSTVTVKAVPSGASLEATIGLRCNRLASADESGAQTMPQVLRMMNAIFSGVQWEAAMIKSPSFSRSSSSVTMTSSPLAKASMASDTEWCMTLLSKLVPVTERKSLGVTAPLVSREINSAVSRDSQASSWLHSWVMVPGDTPMRRAKSTRLTALDLSHSASFMERV